jgi:hypothetical protein
MRKYNVNDPHDLLAVEEWISLCPQRVPSIGFTDAKVE